MGSEMCIRDRAIIGALGNDDDEAGTDAGSAYIFEVNGTDWNETMKLTASDAAEGDVFGSSVSIDGDRAIIGANRNDDDAGTDAGSAYIFEFDGTQWKETAILTASDAAANDNFGRSVSINGDRAIIGAPGNDDDGNASGSAYIFEVNGTDWNETMKPTASDAAADDLFGSSVSIDGDRAIIGANQNDDNGSNSGSAYIFCLDNCFKIAFDFQRDIVASTPKVELCNSQEQCLTATLTDFDGAVQIGQQLQLVVKRGDLTLLTQAFPTLTDHNGQAQICFSNDDQMAGVVEVTVELVP